jgi:COP9 signalosome complex subunit 2
MEDDYYYDEGYDDYYDNGADEVADVDPLEVKYIDGKSYMQNNVEESLRCLREVLDEDGEHGRWTFKALKMLCRACRLAKQYEQMAHYYDRVAHFSHPDINEATIAKAMLKFSEESKRVPGQWRERTLQITLEVALSDTIHYCDVLVPTLLQRATLFLEENKCQAALDDLQSALQQCRNLDATATQLHATSVYQIRALQLVAYRKLRRYADLRSTYNAIGHVHAALPPLRMVGGVMESAGHLFLHDRDWGAAHRAFTSALRCYTECGDARQYAIVKYVVLATMMADLPVDIFSQDDAFADHPYVRPVRALWRAFTAADIPAFFAVLKDPDNVACFTQDEEFSPYVDVAVQQLRVNYLVGYTASFATVSVADLCRRLQMEEQLCKELCASVILQGRLEGYIDDDRQLLCMLSPATHRRLANSSNADALRSFSLLTSELCCSRLRY